MALPLLTVISGRPGSGKTSLAHEFARALRCPAICRDEIKEGLVATLDGEPITDDTNREANTAFFETVSTLLRHRISLVAEAAFQHKLWAPGLEPLLQVARVKVVICVVDPAVARARHIARGLADPERERFHQDRPVQAAREGFELPIAPYDPPHFDVPTLEVDTTDGYRPAFEEIVAFARG